MTIPEYKVTSKTITKDNAHALTIESVRGEFDNVIDKINEAAKNGQYNIYLINTHPSIIKELNDNGFSTITTYKDNDRFVNVRWCD